jgi:effector-binding domain-containing protein
VGCKPRNLAQPVKIPGRICRRFVLTGPYSGLPEASGRVYETVSQKKIQLGDDFRIENYVNEPRTTPEDQLVTEILVPML